MFNKLSNLGSDIQASRRLWTMCLRCMILMSERIEFMFTLTNDGGVSGSLYMVNNSGFRRLKPSKNKFTWSDLIFFFPRTFLANSHNFRFRHCNRFKSEICRTVGRNKHYWSISQIFRIWFLSMFLDIWPNCVVARETFAWLASKPRFWCPSMQIIYKDFANGSHPSPFPPRFARLA